MQTLEHSDWLDREQHSLLSQHPVQDGNFKESLETSEVPKGAQQKIPLPQLSLDKPVEANGITIFSSSKGSEGGFAEPKGEQAAVKQVDDGDDGLSSAEPDLVVMSKARQLPPGCQNEEGRSNDTMLEISNVEEGIGKKGDAVSSRLKKIPAAVRVVKPGVPGSAVAPAAGPPAPGLQGPMVGMAPGLGVGMYPGVPDWGNHMRMMAATGGVPVGMIQGVPQYMVPPPGLMPMVSQGAVQLPGMFIPGATISLPPPMMQPQRYQFGQIIGCSEATLKMYHRMPSFLLPSTALLAVDQITPSCCALFIFDVDTQSIHGYFRSASNGWDHCLMQTYEGLVRAPMLASSVGFEVVEIFPAGLARAEFQPVFGPMYLNHWHLPMLLSSFQVEQLLALFESKKSGAPINQNWVPPPAMGAAGSTQPPPPVSPASLLPNSIPGTAESPEGSEGQPAGAYPGHAGGAILSASARQGAGHTGSHVTDGSSHAATAASSEGGLSAISSPSHSCSTQSVSREDISSAGPCETASDVPTVTRHLSIGHSSAGSNDSPPATQVAESRPSSPPEPKRQLGGQSAAASTYADPAPAAADSAPIVAAHAGDSATSVRPTQQGQAPPRGGAPEPKRETAKGTAPSGAGGGVANGKQTSGGPGEARPSKSLGTSGPAKGATDGPHSSGISFGSFPCGSSTIPNAESVEIAFGSFPPVAIPAVPPAPEAKAPVPLTVDLFPQLFPKPEVMESKDKGDASGDSEAAALSSPSSPKAPAGSADPAAPRHASLTTPVNPVVVAVPRPLGVGDVSPAVPAPGLRAALPVRPPYAVVTPRRGLPPSARPSPPHPPPPSTTPKKLPSPLPSTTYKYDNSSSNNSFTSNNIKINASNNINTVYVLTPRAQPQAKPSKAPAGMPQANGSAESGLPVPTPKEKKLESRMPDQKLLVGQRVELPPDPQQELCLFCFERRADFFFLTCKHWGPCLHCHSAGNIVICRQPNCGLPVDGESLHRVFR